MNIKELRTKLKLSQEKLAQKLGVSWTTISRWERGETKPSPMAIKNIQNLIEQEALEILRKP